MPYLGSLLLAGGTGLLVGLVIPLLGIAAAVGLGRAQRRVEWSSLAEPLTAWG